MHDTGMKKAEDPIVALMNEDGVIVALGNPDEDLLHDREVLVGREAWAHLHDIDAKILRYLFEQVITTGEARYLDKAIRFLDGRILDVSIQLMRQGDDIVLCCHKNGTASEEDWIYESFGAYRGKYGLVFCS